MHFFALSVWTWSAAHVVAEAIDQCGSHSRPWIKDFDNLVTFGDSYTDESRLHYFADHNGTAPPAGLLLPESTSTAGGGITWARWVANYTGAKLYNYAVAGGVCDSNLVYLYFAEISKAFPDVIYGVDAFIADTKFINASTNTNTLYTDRRENNTVYSIWIGTNDLRNNGFLTDSNPSGTTISNYVDCIYNRFDEIYKNGGRYFVLMNTPPLELSPLYNLPQNGELTASQYWPEKTTSNLTETNYKIKEYTSLVNRIFDYRTPYELTFAKRYPDASFAVFDVNSLMAEMFHNPSQYFASPANVTGQYHLCDAAGGPCTNSSLSLDHFLWFDELHPSERADQVIAEEFQKVVMGSSRYATYW